MPQEVCCWLSTIHQEAMPETKVTHSVLLSILPHSGCVVIGSYSKIWDFAHGKLPLFAVKAKPGSAPRWSPYCFWVVPHQFYSLFSFK